MKRSRPIDIAPREKFVVAKTMHLVLLDEIFRATRWQAPQAVFHGGTALALAHNSERFSEDLDFMVDRQAFELLEKSLEQVLAAVTMRIASILPGSRVSMVGPNGRTVTNWIFTWSHPDRRGTIKVKAEFLLSDATLLANYRSRNVVPVVAGVPALVSVRTSIPVPALISSWADKIKAVATRPEMKWRDMYDLSFIANHLRLETIDDELRLAALLDTISIYDDTPAEILQKLEAIHGGALLQDNKAFAEDMKRWLSHESWEMNSERGTFEEMMRDARAEISRGLDVLRAHVRSPAP